MGRGGKVEFKRGTRKRVRPVGKGSDESDEDYIVGEDEAFDESEEEEYVSSFDEDELEESLAEFEDEDEEEEFVEKKAKKVKKVGKPKKVNPGRKRNGVVKPNQKKRGSYREKDGYDDCDDSDEYVDGRRNEVTKPRKKNRISYREEDDENYDDDDDDDEEFRLDEIHEDVEDEDVMMETKGNKKLRRPRMHERRFSKGQKRKRSTKVLKKTVGKKLRENRRRGHRKGQFEDSKTRVEQNKKKVMGRIGKRRVITDSDSDFVNSGLSDYEYTISEEEREQIREANEFCKSLTISLRSSVPIKKPREEQEPFYPQRKRMGRKGKEKEEDLKIETGKQVCGICLSEEGKRTVRGTLNCCSHYFCFACIMEWSKVESRCPLCKQRFITICKPARSDSGFDLRTVVIPVPERDQVYQPSEEELRGYLDPYESVICTECHHGGDDALMLLCDLCDSPAHTYCVGLGHEVPEGNWYCEGCRPTALDSLNAQGLIPTPDHRTNNNFSGGSSPMTNVRETFDLNEAYVPETPMTQGTGQPSPRFFGADFQASSPASGSGPATLFERRRIQRQIHQIISNRMQQDTGTDGSRLTISGNSLFGSQIGRVRELAAQHAVGPEARMASHRLSFRGRSQGNGNSDAFAARPTLLEGSEIPNQASTSAASSFGGMLHNEFAGMNMRNSLGLGLQQMHPCSVGSNIGSDASVSPHQFREVSPFNIGKEQVQSMVKSQLKSLSREWELGYSAFKDIARSCTHTILAACRLEHRSNEVYPVQAVLICRHVEHEAGGQISPKKGHCSSCFDLFVRDVVREIINGRVTLSSKD